MWAELRDHKLDGLKFYRQYPLFVEWLGAETFFVADFFCFDRQLVVEVDGKVHDYRVDHDQLRTFVINQLGLRVVRFRNAQIETDLPGVLAELRCALDGSAANSSPTPSLGKRKGVQTKEKGRADQ